MTAPQVEFRPRSRINPRSTYLLEYASNITSQHGEDGIIAKIFEIVPPANLWCLEIGAFDGKLLSNTWSLITQRGWRAVLVEGNDDQWGQLAARFSRDNPEIEGRFADHVALVHKYADFEGESSLDGILSAAGAPKDLDFMSIDIDSNDWHLWDSLVQYKPRVLMIEFNTTIPNDVYYVQARDSNVTQGCSLLALIELGKRKGYELVVCTPANAIFVRAELYPAFNIPDNDIDAMYFYPYLQTRLFQGYDGELILAGYQQLHWPNVPFSAADVQVLPEPLRRYGMQFHDTQKIARSRMGVS